MSSAEEKADVQVTHPGHVFPFGACAAGSPLPQLTQCCRFSIPERLPLRPFRQDRLPRLPLPSSLMASTSKTVSLTGAGVSHMSREQRNGLDPVKKAQQLEKSISFLQDSHALMLKGLHEEISDLKQKNRELHFQLITGCPALPPDSSNAKTDDISPKAQEKIEKLEKEVKKLRSALKDALKSNASLTNELQTVKKECYAISSSNVVSSSKDGVSHGNDSRRGKTPHGPSPGMEEYSDTLQKIQWASTDSRNPKTIDGYQGEHPNKYWGKGGNGYAENRRSYNYHRMAQQSQSSEYQQPRLPRLPLRHQLQNYTPPNQYDIPYQQRSSSTLPSLKQSHNEHTNRQRRTRGPQQAKVADRIYNH